MNNKDKQVYEALFCVNPEVDMTDIKNTLLTNIQDQGAEIITDFEWDDRNSTRLHIGVRKTQTAKHYLVYFKIDPSKLKDLSREFRFKESLLRHGIFKIDEKHVPKDKKLVFIRQEQQEQQR